VQTWSFVFLFKFSAGQKFYAPKPARTQSPKTLAVIVERHERQQNINKMTKSLLIIAFSFCLTFDIRTKQAGDNYYKLKSNDIRKNGKY